MQQYYKRLDFFWMCLSFACVAFPVLGSNLGSLGNPGVHALLLPNPSPCGLALPINDNSCDASHRFQIQVSGLTDTVLGINVFLKEVRFIIKHEWLADLDMTLESPAGTIVELSTDNGSGNDHYGNPFNGLCNEYTSLISHAIPAACSAPSVVNGQAPFIGNYLPEGNFVSFNNGSNPNGIWVLQICDDGKEHFGTLEFIELVFESSLCLPPSSVSVVDLDSTSVSLQWNAGSNCSNTILEYGPTGFQPGTGLFPGEGTVVLLSCPPYTLQGLTPASNYTVYLREYCGNNNFSTNSCPLSFVTKCSPPPPTIREDFNSQALCAPFCEVACPLTGTWSNALDDNFDWLVFTGPSTTPLTGPQDDVPGGGNYIYIETSGTECRSGSEAHLISNCIEVHANFDSCDFSFNYLLNGVHVNRLLLQVSQDGGLTWATLWQASGNNGPEWKKKFIDLSPFDGKIVQFRFVGQGGFGFRGDIAIDNIVFYGSVDLGKAPYVYYLDGDGDGYGTPLVSITSCQPLSIPGYVEEGGDCDDQLFFINPGMDEFPCDGVDFNCNGMIDEFDVLPPVVTEDSVCNGEPAVLAAFPAFGGTIHWFDAETGGNLVHQGENFSPASLPVNTSSAPIVITYFAEEVTIGSCVSTSRMPANIVIYPQPALNSSDTPEGCAGELFDLTTINVSDTNATNGVLSYYQSLPFVPSNQIGPVVFPATTTTFYIVSTTPFGCSDYLSLNYFVKPTPVAHIIGDSALCFNSDGSLQAVDEGNGLLPLTFQWNTGDTVASIYIGSNPIAGATDLYSITVTGSNGCSSSDSILVGTVTSIDTVETMVVPVSTCDGNNGAIIVTPLDGVPPFNYRWNGASVGQANGLPGALHLDNLKQGTFAFTITDSSPHGCEFTLPIVVVNGPSAIITNKKVTPVSCFGASDGCLEVEVIGNNPTITWSTGAVGNKICNLQTGVYSVTVVDGECSNALEFFVPQPQELVVHPVVQDVSCPGKNDGSILLNTFGGTPPYQYAWSHGVSTSFAGNLASGFYTATVTDKRGCQVVLVNITVKQPQALSVNTQLWQPPGCFGGTDGAIAVAGGGGTKPYNFVWSTGAVGNNLVSIPAGNYSVTMTDVKGCTFSSILVLPEPAPLDAQPLSTQNPTCNGINNGTISVLASGGVPGYSYTWNNGAQGAIVSNLGAGSYVVTVTDQNGCSKVSDTLKLNGAETLQVHIESQSPTCIGVNDGSIQLTVITANPPPFEFYWDDGNAGNPVLNHLGPGQYTVTITDANGCLSDTTVTLVAPQVLNVLPSLIAPACHGDATGQICLSITQGTLPYNILWNNGQQGACIGGLPPGSYVATVTDANGCTNIKELPYLVAPPPLSIFIETIEKIACHGGTEGGIDVAVSGGVLPYQYFWSNGQTTEDLKMLGAGTYTLTIVDANNCVLISEPVVIDSPEPLSLVAVGVEAYTCQSAQVDSVCVEVSGGVAPFHYLWSNGNTSACLTDVPVGDYVVTVTDAAGCTQELMSIKVPETIFFLSVSPHPLGKEVICAGGADGAVSVTIVGGAKPYQYIWSNGVKGTTNENILTLNGLVANSYRVTITDNYGCTSVSAWLVVSSPPPLIVTIPGSQVQHVRCKAGINGSINMNVTGGSPPYQFLWKKANGDTVGTSEDLTGLKAGVYSVTVTDALHCTATATATVTEPSTFLSIQNPPPVVEDVSCFGLQDGKIDITPTGGVAPYTYEWNINATTQDLNNLSAGTYQVTITDANGCLLIPAPFEVKQPLSALGLVSIERLNPSCFGQSDGAIEITVTGGTPPYYFNWSLPSVEEDPTNIPAGTYHLTVFDANLCLFDTTIMLVQPSKLMVNAIAQPSQGGQSNGSIALIPSGGTPPYSYQWANGKTDSLLTGLAPGWYEVTVTDAHFCEVSLWVQVQSLVSTDSDEGAAIHFLLAPNPTSGKSALLTQSSTSLVLEVKVVNTLGKVLIARKDLVIESSYQEIDLSDYPPGVYFVFAEVQGKRLFTGKLVLH